MAPFEIKFRDRAQAGGESGRSIPELGTTNQEELGPPFLTFCSSQRYFMTRDNMKIDSHSFGRITIDGRVYTRDVVIYPERVDDQWWRKEGHELSPQDLTEILDQAPEILVVGTGDLGCMRVLAETKELLKARGVQLIECSTRRACEEYNRLSGGKKVIAALHLTC